MQEKFYKKDDHFPKHPYNYLYLPAWPELYTGTLKAAWYLFLDRTLENIVFLRQQTEAPDKIISYTDTDKFLVWWRPIKNEKGNLSVDSSPVPDELFDQLFYIRLLTQVASVTMLGIWSNVSAKEIQRCIDEIEYSKFWIVVLGTSSEKKEVKASKNEDVKMVEHLLSKKIYKDRPNWIGNIYTNLGKKYKWKPELVAYIHASDLWIKTIQQIWYICMVA